MDTVQNKALSHQATVKVHAHAGESIRVYMDDYNMH